MDKNAIIKVSSLQLSNDNDKIEVISKGNFKILDEGYEVSYEESEISGMEGTTTTIKVTSEKVILERKGSTESMIIFEDKGSHVSLYNTPYGMLELITNTESLEIDINEDGGKINIDYEVAIAGQDPIKTNLSMGVQVN